MTGDLHNGSAADFGSACEGSIPSSPAKFIDMDELITQLNKESVDRNASFALFRNDPTYEGYKLHMALFNEGWSREQLIEKTMNDTAKWLIDNGYEYINKKSAICIADSDDVSKSYCFLTAS